MTKNFETHMFEDVQKYHFKTGEQLEHQDSDP
jgi:hypothetical protein